MPNIFVGTTIMTKFDKWKVDYFIAIVRGGVEKWISIYFVKMLSKFTDTSFK